MSPVMLTHVCLEVPLTEVFKHLLHISVVGMVHMEEGYKS